MKKLVYLLLVFVVGTVPALAVDAGTFTSVRASRDVALETNPKSTFWQGSDPSFIVNDNWGSLFPVIGRKFFRAGRRTTSICCMCARTKSCI